MTNYEKFKRDFALIAKNHGFESTFDESPCILGYSGPTSMDVAILCDSVKIPIENIEADRYAIVVVIDEQQPYMSDEWAPEYEWWLKREQTTVKLKKY